MSMRRGLLQTARLGAVALVGIALTVAGCATADPRLAQSGPAESWGKCDPSPRTSFTLLCYKR